MATKKSSPSRGRRAEVRRSRRAEPARKRTARKEAYIWPRVMRPAPSLLQ
jgi:hypothetical protein